MSKDVCISILLPIIEQFDKNKIYSKDELSYLDDFYKKAPDDKYLRTLKVSSTYAAYDELSKCAAEKLNIQEKACSIRYFPHDGAVSVAFPSGVDVVLNEQEVESSATEHVAVNTFCRYYGRYSPDSSGWTDIVATLLKDRSFMYIDDDLIRQAESLTGEERSIEELKAYLDGDSSYGFGCVQYLSAAKQLADKVGGVAVLEYE